MVPVYVRTMLQNPPALLTKAETADLLRVSVKTLDRWRAAGLLVPIELGEGVRSIRYRREDVEALIGRASA